jgi:flagellar biosynthetic protein FlhB
MSDQQEKTEDASPFKLDEARKKGMVPHSADLMSLAIVGAFLMAMTATGANLARAIAVHTRWWLENAGMLAANPGQMLGVGGRILQAVAYAALPLIAAMVIMAILVNLLFSGFVFSTAPLKPDFKRLHPVQGLKKVFSRRMLIEMGKLLIKALLFAVVMYWIFEGVLQRLLGSALVIPIYLPALLQSLVIQVGVALLAVMALAAIWDMWMPMYAWERSIFCRATSMWKSAPSSRYHSRSGCSARATA